MSHVARAQTHDPDSAIVPSDFTPTAADKEAPQEMPSSNAVANDMPPPPPPPAPNGSADIPPASDANSGSEASAPPPQLPSAVPINPKGSASRPMNPATAQPNVRPLPPPLPAPAPQNSPIVISKPTPTTMMKPSGPDVKGLAELSFLEPYVFDIREGRRNPFRPPMSIEESSKSNAAFPGTPLERYELEEIRLIGIMWEIKTPKAMFVDPQGEVHILAKDDRIGRKHGYIAVIREGEVVVVEPSSFGGESAFSTRILQLDKERKEKR